MPLGVEAVTRALIKRAQRGLYAGRQKLFGNKISEDGGNKCVLPCSPARAVDALSCNRALPWQQQLLYWPLGRRSQSSPCCIAG